MVQVSIITPCFNNASTIDLTIESIKNQSFENYEVLIIDDCSKDNSLEIINKSINNDKRFRLFARQKNYGVVNSRNFALEKARGRYIAFLDSDDIWKKDFLRKSINIHKLFEPGITHGPFYRFCKYKGKYLGQEYFPPKIVNKKNIRKKNHMGLLTTVLDRKIIGEFKFKNIRPEDYFLWCDLIINKKFYSKSIGDLEAYYRISSRQRSKNKFNSFFRLFKFYSKYLNQGYLKAIYFMAQWTAGNLMQRFSRKFIMNMKQHKEIFRKSF